MVVMFKTREARMRLLSYVGLGFLALATGAMLIYVSGTSGWDAPWGIKVPW